MAARTPLILDGDNNLIQMTSAQITAVQDRARYVYGTNPSVTLAYIASGGSLGTISDTRKTAGAVSTTTGNQDADDDGAAEYADEATTAEPGTVTVNYGRVDQTVASPTQDTDTNNKAYPVYFNASNEIQAMTRTDFYDTFIRPAIDTLQGSVGQPGTYRIHTATTLSGYTAVSTNAVFSDTRADTTLYTAGGIGDDPLDQPTTITNYYLLQADNISAPSMELPIQINGDNDLQQYSQANFDTLLENAIRYVAASDTGSTLRYRWSTSGTGTNLGTGMTDTILNGSGNYQTRFVDVDDYRAQEFPDGTPITANTYYLRSYQA
jgi:hypothetical protein